MRRIGISYTRWEKTVLATLLMLALCAPLCAQDSFSFNANGSESAVSQAAAQQESAASFKRLPKNLLEDQQAIFSSPLHFRVHDLQWALPLVAGTALAFASDQAAIRHLPSPSMQNHAVTASNVTAGLLAGAAAAQYLEGRYSHNNTLSERGFLSIQAAADSLILTTGIGLVARRERPTDGPGDFFQPGHMLDSSFVSQHSAAAWAIATVMAQNRGPLTKLLAYGGATAVAGFRVAGKKHFPSDVVVGSSIGYLTGLQVFRTHSAEAKQNRLYGTFEREPKVNRAEPRQADTPTTESVANFDSKPAAPQRPHAESTPPADSMNYGVFESGREARNPAFQASPYVPLDSWVYGAFERLDAAGYTRSAIMSSRPWTSMYCAQMLEELSLEDNEDVSPLIRETVAALRAEFAYETGLLHGERNVFANLREVYVRPMGIAGTPLTDGMHFAQTVVDDYGRPVAEGMNSVFGMRMEGAAGPLVGHVTVEYQQAPSISAEPLAVRQAIGNQDVLPVAPGTPIDATNRLRVLEAYLALNVRDFQVSFGRQSLWWGPGEGTAMVMSNNAEPLPMLRVSRAVPRPLPGLLSYLGPVSGTFFVAQTNGYHFLREGPTFQLVGSWDKTLNPQPYIWGGQLILKPTPNLELGGSMTVVFAGLGRPANLDTFLHTFSSNGNAQAVEPGDRRTEFTLRYRLPFLRRVVSVYSGSISEDEPNPICYTHRSGWNPGVYFAHLPHLSRVDLRVESVYTTLPTLNWVGFFYTNEHYAGGYTNDGNIIGSWIGPEGRAIQVNSNYWFSPRRHLSVGFRHQGVEHEYLRGGNLDDFSGGYQFRVGDRLDIAASAQYERWNFPTLSAQTNSNMTMAVKLSWTPKDTFWVPGKRVSR